MFAMLDARCGKCNARIGWAGDLRNRPACHKCGHRPPQTELDAEQIKMDSFSDLLEQRAKDSGGAELREKRKLAGLNLLQAVALAASSSISIETLSAWERGQGKPNEEQAVILDLVYGTD